MTPSSDPKLMANGIGQAMIATVLGLGIAIPLLFVNAALGSLSDGVTQVLDEQSTGILAELVERACALLASGLAPLLQPTLLGLLRLDATLVAEEPE